QGPRPGGAPPGRGGGRGPRLRPRPSAGCSRPWGGSGGCPGPGGRPPGGRGRGAPPPARPGPSGRGGRPGGRGGGPVAGGGGAEQISLRRRVALKVLPFAAVMDPRHLQRFKNEALAAAGLDHSHVVKVYGVGSDRGVHYIAMQLVDGRTLADLIRERRGGPTA